MRILLVEDEAKVSSFVARGLTEERFAVDVAADGKAGLDLATTYHYDLVILDLMLPTLDGSQVLRRHSQGERSGPGPDPDRSRRGGGQSRQFRGRSRRLPDQAIRLCRTAGSGESFAPARTRHPQQRGARGDLELDRLSQQVKRAGKRIDLTAKEYSLLEYLMSNAGRVLSRTMIIEHVWDQSFDGITNIVDVYVRHLRSKVDDPFDPKLIRTVRGVGYTIGHGAQP